MGVTYVGVTMLSSADFYNKDCINEDLIAGHSGSHV